MVGKQASVDVVRVREGSAWESKPVVVAIMSYSDSSQKDLFKQELTHKFFVLISTSNKRRLVYVRIIMFL